MRIGFSFTSGGSNSGGSDIVTGVQRVGRSGFAGSYVLITIPRNREKLFYFVEGVQAAGGLINVRQGTESSGPFAVDGYYPLYNTAKEAQQASPTPSESRPGETTKGYHTHTLGGVVYYMPNGLGGPGSGSQFHGDYVESTQFRTTTPSPVTPSPVTPSPVTRSAPQTQRVRAASPPPAPMRSMSPPPAPPSPPSGGGGGGSYGY